MASGCIRADAGLQQKNHSWRSRTQSWTRHDTPPREAAVPNDAQENASKGTVVTQSQGVARVALVLWNKLMARANEPE